MLPGADLSSLRPVLTVQALTPLDTTADPRQETLSRLLQIAVGQQVQGKVLGALANGNYLVKIAETTAKMALPLGLKAGDILHLTMLDKTVRPTFLLSQHSDSAPATISSAARLIDRVLQATASGAGATLEGDKPLMDVSAASLQTNQSGLNGKDIAASLQNALVKSGLFYESHLAQWAGGRMPLEALQQEPQARYGAFFQGEAAAGSAPADPRHAQIATIVGAQIDTLENQRLAWQGEAWPGQPVRVEVERRQDDAPNSQNAPEPIWQSNVRFELPQLGRVTATACLINGRVQMQVRADTPESVTTLKMHAATLAGAIAAAGLPLDRLAVNGEADAAS